MTDKPEPTASVINFIDSPMAPDVFADDAVGFVHHNGIVKITFVAARVNHMTNPGPINRVVIGRLAMPIPAAHALAVGLFDFLKKHGFDLPHSAAKPN
jgi:hypothetical protein